jgi:hypothetical protein
MTKEQADNEMARLVSGYAAAGVTDEEYQAQGRWLGPTWTRLWQDELGYTIPCDEPRSAA